MEEIATGRVKERLQAIHLESFGKNWNKLSDWVIIGPMTNVILRRRLFLTLCLVFVTPLAALPASPNPYGIPDQTDKEIRETFYHLFNLKFDEAGKHLALLKSHAKDDHPMTALAEVVFYWWTISVNVLETDGHASRPFLDASERCLKISEKKIAREDAKGEAQLALGTTLGLMSRWSAANRAWLAAYTRGKKSANHLNEALKKNPHATDAYMTLGTFNYARELIRKRLSNADKEEKEKGTTSKGIGQLRKAYTEGIYFKEAAGLLLAGVLTNENPKEALPILRDLKRALPDSGFVQMVLITALYNAGRSEEMASEVDQFFEKIASGQYPASFKPQAHFAKGLLAFRKRRWKEAYQHFERAQQQGDEKNPYVTWAHLYQGYTLDAMGQRDQAKKNYARVLKMKRRFASYEHAEERLKKPFSPSDPETKKLEL